MKTIIIISFLLSTKIFGQALTEKEIHKHVNTIDSLKKEKGLQMHHFSNMSFCGGGLKGYFYKDKLVYIDATYQGELGYSSKQMYLNDTVIYKIRYREHFPEWEKYAKNHPNEKEELDPSKMTYTDTLYTIILSEPIRFVKSSNKKIISKKVNFKLVNDLIICGRRMKLELESEKNNE